MIEDVHFQVARSSQYRVRTAEPEDLRPSRIVCDLTQTNAIRAALEVPPSASRPGCGSADPTSSRLPHTFMLPLRVRPHRLIRRLLSSDHTSWYAQKAGELLAKKSASRTVEEYWSDRGHARLISKSATVEAAAKKMASHDLTYLGVVDDDGGAVPLHAGQLVGLATERNFLSWSVRQEARPGIENVTAMTTPTAEILSVRASTPVGACLQLMRSGIFRNLPVLSEDGQRCVGILSTRELLAPPDAQLDDFAPVRTAHVRRPTYPTAEARADELTRWQDARAGGGSQPAEVRASGGGLWGDWTAGDVLIAKRAARGINASNLKSFLRRRAAMHLIDEHSSMHDAAAQMAEHKLTFLLVVDSAAKGAYGEVLGMFSERQYLRCRAEDFLARRDRSRTPLSEVMAPLHLCARASDPADKCLALMMSRQTRHLPVLDNRDMTLAGILSLRDMIGPLVPGGYGDSVDSLLDRYIAVAPAASDLGAS